MNFRAQYINEEGGRALIKNKSPMPVNCKRAMTTTSNTMIILYKYSIF